MRGSLTVTQARSATCNSIQLEQIRGAVEMRLAKTDVSFHLRTKKYRNKKVKTAGCLMGMHGREG